MGKWKRVVILTWEGVGGLPGEWPVKVASETKVGTSSMVRKKVQGSLSRAPESLRILHRRHTDVQKHMKRYST